MECKDVSNTSFYRFFFDLIETLWNVKPSYDTISDASEWDLIETLWNVKDARSIINGHVDLRFNRDIVECKVCRYRSNRELGEMI